jgi:hypothetical protein
MRISGYRYNYVELTIDYKEVLAILDNDGPTEKVQQLFGLLEKYKQWIADAKKIRTKQILQRVRK